MGPQLQDGGWTIHGNGGAATKAAYNLLGGFVEFDVDFSGVTPGVNANIYTISPSIGGGGYQGGNYCDGAVKTNHGAWRWIGSSPTAIVEVPRPCTRNKVMVQTDAQLGAAEQATTIMADRPSTCASSMAKMAAGPQSEMDR